MDTKKSSEWWIALALIGCAVLLYIPYITRTPKYDESYTFFRYSLAPTDVFIYGVPNNHILNSLFTWISQEALGFNTLAMRFHNFCFSLLSIALIYRLGRKISGHRTGIAAAAFLISNYTFADYVVEGRGYVLNILLVLTFLCLLYPNLDSPNPRRGRLMLLNCAALVLTLPSTIIFIACIGVWLVWLALWYKNRQMLGWLAPMIVGTVCGIIFYIPSFALGIFNTEQMAGLESVVTLVKDWLAIIFITPVVSMVLLAGLLVGFIHLDRRLWGIISFSFLGALVLAAVQLLITERTFYARNYLYLLVLISIVGGIGLSRVAKHWTAPLAVILVISCIFPFRAMGSRTVVDDLLGYVDSTASSETMYLIGCCVEDPTLFSLTSQGRIELLYYTEEKTQVYVIDTGTDRYEYLLDAYALTDMAKGCQRQEPAYSFGVVYRCALEPSNIQ